MTNTKATTARKGATKGNGQRAAANAGLEADLFHLGPGQPLRCHQQLVRRASDDEHQNGGNHELGQGEA